MCPCSRAGALRLGRVALDGTKMQANASKHKAMSWGRMRRAEKQIAAEVQQMLAEAAEADAAEDAHYGPEQTGQELPEELQRRQTRLEKIRQAQKALKQRARGKAAAQDQSADDVRKAKPRIATHKFATVQAGRRSPPFALTIAGGGGLFSGEQWRTVDFEGFKLF